MTAIPQPRLTAPPPRLAGPLRQVARRQWSVVATRGVVLTLLASLAILLAALLVIGLFPYVPLGARVAAAAGVWAAVLAVGIHFLRPAMRKRSLVNTAMDVERRMAAAGVADTHERIASALELSQEADARFAGSPALVQHLVRQAEADAALVRPDRLVSARPVGWLALLLLPMLGLWVTLALLLPPSKFLRPLFHLLLPWQETPAFLSDVVVKPGDVTVAQGDPVTIEIVVNPRDLADKDRQVARATLFVRDAAAKDAAELAMARAGPRAFTFTRPAEKTFRYRVGTDVGDSTWYTVTAEPVPAARSVAVRYDYPAYAQLPPRTDLNRDDGAIDALQNTKVTVAVEADNDLTAASKLVVTDKLAGGPALKLEDRDLLLTKVADGRYETSFVLTGSGSYKVRLTNGYARQNRDADRARPITARADEKPTITLTAPTSDLTVRPQETVPVAFQAADDFGVAKVELLAQADGAGDVMSFPVALADRSAKLVTGRHPLAIKDVVERAQAAVGGTNAGKPADVRSVTYWLRATDVRDPAPQSAESNRQTLRVDRQAESLAAKQDRADAKDFTEAIRTAIRRLEEVRPEVESFKWSGRDQQALNPDGRRRAEEAKDRLEKAGNELVKEANAQATGTFAALAEQARQTADGKILAAADAMAKVDLNSDRFEPRKAAADQAGALMSQSVKELKDLLTKVEDQARLADARHKFEDLARKQEEVAKAMQEAAATDKTPQQDRQNRLNDQTREAIEAAKLNDGKAQEQARALQQLTEQVQKLQQDQQKASDQNVRQAEMAAAAGGAKSTAEKQSALNEKVGAFAKEDRAALEQAGARPPEPKQLADIVKSLNAAELQRAADGQREAASRLEENARQLAAQAKNEKPPLAGDPQRAVEQAKAAAQASQQAADQAKQQQAKANEANQQAARAADRAAEAAKGEDAEAQKAAAQQAAEAAKQASAAAQQARQQADAVQRKAEAAQKAGDAKAREAAQQASQTAKQAQAAAKEAQAAAAEAQKSADQAAKAQEAKNAAQEQQATARAGEQAKQAGRKAAEAAEQAAAAAQQLAQGQQQAARQMQADARQQVRQSAQAAADEAQGLAKAQRALADEAAGQAKAQEQGAVPPQQAAARQQQLAQQAAKTARQAEQLEQMAEQSANAPLAQRAEAAAEALEEAQTAQEKAAEAQKEGNGEQAAGAQEKAKQSLAQAEQALRGQQPKPPQAGNPGQQPPAEQAAGDGSAGESPPKPGEPSQPGQGQQGQAGELGQGSQPAMTPQQARQQAAQSAAEAQSAQQQAAQGNRAAAQQAAKALAQAAQALAQASGQQGQPGQGQAQAQGKQPGQQPGEGEGQDQPSDTPGQSNDPKQGIAAQQTGGPAGVPAAVSDLGITPSDWAKLGPLQQRDLVGAAQQAGPPEYQAMVKNYYVRIARMQARGQGQ